MSVPRRAALWALLVLLSPGLCPAQKVDAAFVVGGSFVPDYPVTLTAPCPLIACAGVPQPVFKDTIQTSSHVFFEGTGAIRVVNARAVTLFVEAPVAFIPSQKMSFSGPISLGPSHISSFFITPSLRVKLLPRFSVSPWGSLGGGWARYSVDEIPGAPRNKGALQYGGGLDFKTRIPALGFRAEVRDFVSSQPDPGIFLYSSQIPSGLHRHNVLLGGGIVLRF